MAEGGGCCAGLKPAAGRLEKLLIREELRFMPPGVDSGDGAEDGTPPSEFREPDMGSLAEECGAFPTSGAIGCREASGENMGSRAPKVGTGTLDRLGAPKLSWPACRSAPRAGSRRVFKLEAD